MPQLKPISPLPKDASAAEREYAEQIVKVTQLAAAGRFENMPAEQQRLEQLKQAVRAERLAAAKRAKTDR